MLSKSRTTIITLVAAFGFSGAAMVPAAAQADRKQQPPAKGCLVEDANGSTYTVPVGTRVGLFFCGADGEWHFGWLVNGRVQTEGPPTKVVNAVAPTSATRLY
jgi:hypothetical protein